MEIQEIIAANLQRVRLQKQLTLAQLAQRSGISKGMLSQIERAETNPTINTIWKICAGLNVPYTALLEQPTTESLVIKTKETALLQKNQADTCHFYCYYAETTSRPFELFYMELHAHTTYQAVGHSKTASEYILIHAGILTLTVADQDFTLKAGEAMTFPAGQAHTYTNSTNQLVTATIINYYAD